MRAKEFIKEDQGGKMSKRQQNPTVGVNKFTDGERWNSDYKLYRLGLALAGCDGINMPEIDVESWVGRWKTAHPYTKEEQDMLKLSYKAVKADYEDINHGDLNSKELDSTNTTSPVSQWMKRS